MTFDNIPLFNLISQRMEILSQRQKIIAQNVANANTPQYKQIDTSSVAGPGQIAMMATTSERPSGFFTINQSSPQLKYRNNISGNDVDLDVEMEHMALVQTDYELMTTLYHKQMTFFNIALG